MLRMIENSPATYAPASIALTPAKLISAGAASISEMGWDYIDRVDADGRLIYIRVKNRHTIFVPRTAFPSPSQADEFLAAVIAFKNGQEMPLEPAPDGVWPPPPRG
jgi:hypothetical protein